MVKNKFLKYSFLLIFVSCISKIMALIIKIFETRILDFKVISMVSLLFPTFNILTTLSLFGTPLATQILISKNKYNNKDILITNIIISLIISILISIFMLMFSNFYIYNILKEDKLIKAYKTLIFILPFTCISGNLRGYFNGKSRYNITSISSILEYIIKLIITITLFPILNKLSISESVLIIFLLNIVYESISILFMSFFMNKDKGIFNKDIAINEKSIIFSFTFKELINSFTMFLEPIIITNFYNNIIRDKYLYMINYNTPLLLAPSFITLSIAPLLITSISKGNKDKNKSILKKTSIFILFISIIYLIILTEFDRKLVYLIFKVKGPSFIKEFPFTFILLYLENIFSTFFDAVSKSKINLYLSILSCIVRSLSLILLSYFNFGINSYIYSLNINIVITFVIQIYFLNKILFSQ